MRARPSTAALVGALVALAALVSCTDAPHEPTAPRLAPRGPSADLLGTASAAPGDTVIAGATFAHVLGRPGGWVETFNVYYFPDNPITSPWTRVPAPWVPEHMAPNDEIASNFLLPNDGSRAPNSLAEWSIVKQMRDPARWYVPEPMMAWHDGATCAAPPAMHAVTSYDDEPFLCRDHMMTAVNASGYGVTYLTPNRLVDFSSGDAVVRFDVATLRQSARDWIDLWITPYSANLVAPLEDSLPDVQGYPSAGLHVRMSGTSTQTRFEAELIVQHRAWRIPPASTTPYEQAFAAYKDLIPGHSGLPSATRRDTFELRLSGGRLRFGMPRYDLWWIDAPVGQLGVGLGFETLGVVQLGHHSFAPATAGVGPDSWHWDNIGMAPAVKFSIVNANHRFVDQSTPPDVQLVRPAPTQARLRFAGYGSAFEVRFDGAGKWSRAAQQDESLDVKGRFHSYWTPIPAGTTRVEFRADNDPSEKKGPARWMARDISVWSLNP